MNDIINKIHNIKRENKEEIIKKHEEKELDNEIQTSNSKN
jgi:hypothetical protein